MIGLMFAHPAMKTKAAGEMRERWRHAVRVSVPVTLFVLAMLTGGMYPRVDVSFAVVLRFLS